jgi:Arc/MetJ-type ribon-helix-helix transcriptional regulator
MEVEILVKIEVEMPKNHVKFIEGLLEWQGEPVDVAEYIRVAATECLQADLKGICLDPQKVDQPEMPLGRTEAAEA